MKKIAQKNNHNFKSKCVAMCCNAYNATAAQCVRAAHVFMNLKMWVKIAIGAVVAIALITIIILIFGGNGRDISRFKISANAPTSISFQDDNAVNFMTNEADNSGDAPSVSLPEPNNDRELSSVQNLNIYYNHVSGSWTPVMKMNLTDKDLNDNIKISPFVKGKWSAHESGVVFIPARDWPADQKFTVKIGKKLFNSDVRVDSYMTSFTTEKLAGNVISFDAYPDLSRKKSMIAVGVISFNYPIDIKTFNEKVSVKLDGKKLDYSVRFDSFYRTAFITSEPVIVTDKPQKLRMNISSVDVLNGNARSDSLDASTTIESADNFFKITSVETQVVDNQAGEPEQLILLNMTSAANNVKWSEYVNVYLLPKNKKSDEDGSHNWKRDEITDTVLANSKKLNIKHINFANPSGVYQYAFAYDVSEKDSRYIYVSIKSGIMSDIGFALKNGSDKIMSVPYPNREVKIAGSGALLSLSGGQKLAIMARGGVDTAYVNLYKVKSGEVNHLISQTYNVFSDVSFKGYAFGPEDISVVFNKKISFSDTSAKKVNYSSVNLGDYIGRTGNDRTGIFIVQTGASQNEADYNDKKLILLTDLGIIRKVNADDSSSVFVSSLGSGAPVSGAHVAVLGRNGNPVWSGDTDWNGRVNAPKLAWNEYKNEREPVAFVVTYGGDISFIPYSSSYDRMVEYSKFDVEGEYVSVSNPMNAFLFSDRGIYRPGEKLIVGGIVKEKNFKSLSGVPVRIEITDARGKNILDKTFSLNSDGLFDIEQRLSGAAPIGDYQIRLYSLTDKNKNKDILGNASIRVEEFVPDTLKINTTIAGAKTRGWIKPSDLKASVSLRNLFGTPATDRRISSRATLTPVQFSFTEFAGYEFTKNFISGTGLSKSSSVSAETVHQTLGDVRTGEDGLADIDVKFDNNVNPGTYVLSVVAEGYEGDSGKSVTASAATKVSDAEYLVGFKPSGNIEYINKGVKRSVNIIAISPDAEKTTAGKLTMRVVKKQTLTSLIKDYNDYYKYQTVTREKVLKNEKIDIPQKGMDINLDTSASGNYYIQIIGAGDRILANIEYFVAGAENLDLKSTGTAELKIKLNKPEFAAGQTIEVSVTSPYTGSGLITIEKDRVYATKWFKTGTTSSVQTITLPDDFEGTGYVNVSFVRDINSRDVFTTPYTYAVAPFAADKSRRTINIDLKTPDVVRDKKLTVKYTTDKSARLMIFAVNEGILQVGKYQNPKPIDHFFKKSALQVTTYQILSLLLPEYKILREFAKTGGGDYEADEALASKNMTNPFARVVDEPVAFYSGIVETVGGVPNVMTFDIPDHFNGAVRVYAVAANASAMGSAKTESKIQSPIIISASAPLMAVPGDEFTVNAVISNMTEKSGKNAKVKTAVKTSESLSVVGARDTTLDIPEISEKLWTFVLKAGDKLGNAEINIMANVLGGDGAAMSSNNSKSTLSIRPASLFETNIITDFATDKKITIKDFQIDQYSEMSTKELYVSTGAFVLVKPLLGYLDNYPYPCSEQTVSRAMPYALFPSNDFLNIDNKKSAAKIESAINVLKNRQNDDGSFSLWDNGGYSDRNNSSDASSAYVTSYVVQFLTIAKDRGFNVPSNMLSRGVDYLRTYAGTNINGKFDADTHAFAIYLVSRNGYVTTSYINGFEEYANANIKTWQSELSGAYIASAYKLLKQNDRADSIIKKYKLSDTNKFVYYYDFANNITNDANYAYLVNTHFDGDISKDKFKQVVDVIRAYITAGNYSSFTSSAAVMALAGASNDADAIGDSISVVGMNGKNNVNLHPIDSKSKDVFAATIPNNVTKLEIACNDCDRDHGVFFTIMQSGFAKKVEAKNRGIEVTREYFNKEGDRVTSATVGDDITVKIFVRATGGAENIDNVVIADLLPAGFSVVSDSISGDMEFSESREDRVLIYKSISRSADEITYRVRVTTSGTFNVPAISAASMYNPQIMGIAKSGTFKVANAKVE